MADGNNFSIETDEKNVVHFVTLHVVDRNVPGCSLVLCSPIINIAMLVEKDQFDSPKEKPKLNFQDKSHPGGAR